MELSTASSLDMKFILDLYMKTFPESERKPFSMIERKTAMGTMEMLIVTENKRRIGFAILVVQDELALLDYFAIAPEYRGRGIGTEALQLMLALYTDRQFYLEIEKPSEQAPNQEERLKRKAFYVKNGMLETGIDVEMFGESMELMSSRPGLEYEKCEQIYRELLGPMYRKFIYRV